MEVVCVGRGSVDSDQPFMVIEKISRNRVEIVLNCANAVPERVPGGVIVAICENDGRRPVRVLRQR
jgi:hypothetical protein